MMLSSLGTAAAFSQIETRRERTFFGALLTSRSTSCEPPALNGTTYSRQVPSSQYGALSRWETFYDGDLLAISMGPLQSVPKIVSIPVPCCDPSDVELDIRRTLGPFQTLACESLNSFYGG